jgi:hypothetical protein
MSGYRFGVDGEGRLTITDTDPGNGDDGVDTLRSIEQAEFADGVVSLRHHTETIAVSGLSGGVSAVAELGDGGYIVTWSSPDGDGHGIYTQRHDAAGNAVGGQTRINTTTTGNQHSPVIAGLADGGYVVAWTSWVDGDDIYTQRYDAAGAAVGGEIRVNTTTSGHQSTPMVEALADGGYVVRWLQRGRRGDRRRDTDRWMAFFLPVPDDHNTVRR